MRLYVNRRYSSHVGTYKAGDIVEVDDALGAWLMRDGEGIFEPVAEVKPDGAEAAISADTGTGLIVPDRRVRGGRLRKAGG